MGRVGNRVWEAQGVAARAVCEKGPLWGSVGLWGFTGWDWSVRSGGQCAGSGLCGGSAVRGALLGHPPPSSRGVQGSWCRQRSAATAMLASPPECELPNGTSLVLRSRVYTSAPCVSCSYLLQVPILSLPTIEMPVLKQAPYNLTSRCQTKAHLCFRTRATARLSLL